MPTDCRLILDEPSDGAWNMAVDEALLESAADGGAATLRLYRWSTPTLSLGYFQSYADRAAHAASRDLVCVRRSSGGGALVHDAEVTYALVLPATAVRGRDARDLYCAAHHAVIDTIAQRSGDATRLSLCQPARSASPPPEEPFLCFQRRADGDLLVSAPFPEDVNATAVGGRYKVCGSAQRKRHGALLQHGGVLLAQSPAAPELPGLAELGLLELGVAAVTELEFAQALAPNLSERLDLRFTEGELSDHERRRADQIRTEKHANPAWTKRR